MAKKTLRDVPDLQARRVLMRVDFNVPVDDRGNITNDRRIRAALPTIQYALDRGAIVVCMSHLGRPKGDPVKDAIYRMDNVGRRLRELLGRPVRKLPEVVGPAVASAVSAAAPGEILLLENLRFHPGEQKGDEALAAALATLGQVYVNDAFGTCHRTDASMYALPKAMADRPRVVGFLVAKELEVLERLLGSPPRPLVGLLGGAKVSDKIGFIKSLLRRVDQLLVGGAMTYTFLQALGQPVGNSRVEADKLEVARELLQLGQGKIVLPTDHLVADRLDPAASTRVVAGAIPDGWIGVDIGPRTMQEYADVIARAGTVVWNGPMGKFEDEPFSHGTRRIAEAMASSPAVTIVGGGETAEAVEAFGLDQRMTHVSTGGGAFLEYVEGTPFQALSVIEDA
jgi:phosphoglycerate kinase